MMLLLVVVGVPGAALVVGLLWLKYQMIFSAVVRAWKAGRSGHKETYEHEVAYLWAAHRWYMPPWAPVYQEGRAAAVEGLLYADNPYEPSDVRNKSWAAGYRLGQRIQKETA